MHTKEYKMIKARIVDIQKGRVRKEYLHWCADRIDWAWKWRKITREEMEELSEIVTEEFDKWRDSM